MTSATHSDGADDLANEIAPAMLTKLRRDGSVKGGLIAVGFFLVWLCLFQVQLVESGASQVFLWGLVVLFALLVILAIYFRRRGVSIEVRYRREHGKWRWER
jgi:hypothetical protein